MIRQGRFRVVAGVAVYVLPRENPGDRARLAVGATRKVGRAVKRNRAKRRIREILRMLLTDVEGVDVVALAISPEPVEADFARLREAIGSALRKLGVPLRQGEEKPSREVAGK